jgi:hypothetical protein
MSEIRILSATGVLDSGFREDALQRAMVLRPDFIKITIPRPVVSGDISFC